VLQYVLQCVLQCVLHYNVLRDGCDVRLRSHVAGCVCVCTCVRVCVYVYDCAYIWGYPALNVDNERSFVRDMGWLQSVASIKL